MIVSKLLVGLSLGIMLLLNTSCTRDEKEKTSGEQDRGIEENFADDHADGLYNVKFFNIVVPGQKQKEDLFSHKKADNLLDKKYIGKILKVKTSKTGEDAKTSMSLAGTFIDPKSRNSFVNDYKLLNYEVLGDETNEQRILADLFKIDQGKFRGFPDTVYDIVPRLEDNYLIFYRVSDLEKVPYIEKPLAIPFGDKVATPLFGYPVEYCVAEQEETRYHEKTEEYERECKNVPKESAKYVYLDIDRKKILKYQPKVDLFPRDFFDGQWLFSKTIIKSSADSITGFHQSFRSANLVDFVHTPDSLQIVDTKQYENSLDEKDRITGLSIPVDWKEYEIDRDSGVINEIVFREREDIDNPDVSRPYFKIKFLELIKNEIGNSKEQLIVDLGRVFIEPGVYFSFVIKVSGSKNRWVKYSFKKVVGSSDYVEKQWFEEESKLFFPVFFNVRKYYRTALDITQRDKERFFRTTRFNPRSSDGSTTRVIKAYFSKQTPKDPWVREFGRKAVKYWNTVFQEAGKGSDYKIKIVLDESEDQELGDLRYDMIINLMVSKGRSGSIFLGWGPNISNPITGEVISATANIWVTKILDSYIDLLKKYIRFRIYPPAWKLLPESYGVTDFIHEKIQKLCPEVGQFITDEKAKGETFHPTKTVINDKEIIKECAPKVAETEILNAVLHEMGHCFAYRHVFSCSADKDNFYESHDEMRDIFGKDILTDDTKSHPHPAQFACVMDYGHPMFPLLSVPGKYDIAVTRFVYFDKVMLNNGKLLDIPAGADNDPENPQKSILEVMEEQQVNLKKYRVCGGKKGVDASTEFNADDPMCAKHDYGKTPLEVMENAIRVNQDIIMTGRTRYDGSNTELFMRGFTQITETAARLHGKIVDYLAELLNKKRLTIMDFSFLSDEDINTYEKMLQDEADSNPEFKAYYDINEPLLNYYKKLFFLPFKHCVYQQGEEYQAVALEVIKQRIEGDYPEDSREIFMNCQSPVVEKWATENNKGTLITEVGYFGNNTEYFLKPRTDDPYDELSLFTLQLPVPQLVLPMIKKNPQLTDYITKGAWYSLIEFMGPALLVNNPRFLKEIVEEHQKYLLEGIDLNPYLNEELDKPLPRFLSYEVDSIMAWQYFQLMLPQIRMIRASHGHMMRKDNFLNAFLLNRLKATQSISIDKKEQMRQLILSKVWAEHELITFLNQDVSALSSLQPFIYEVYQEHSVLSNSGETPLSFVEFLLNDQDVCKKESQHAVLVPLYSSEQRNRSAQMCRKANEYKQCVDNHSDATPCENIDDKKVFVEYML